MDSVAPSGRSGAVSGAFVVASVPGGAGTGVADSGVLGVGCAGAVGGAEPESAGFGAPTGVCGGAGGFGTSGFGFAPASVGCVGLAAGFSSGTGGFGTLGGLGTLGFTGDGCGALGSVAAGFGEADGG